MERDHTGGEIGRLAEDRFLEHEAAVRVVVAQAYLDSRLRVDA